MTNIDIRKYLKDETMQARIEYKVAELGLSERVDSVADEIASDYDAGKMQDTDPFGFPRNEREPHVVALDELIFNIQSMARQEYFKQMSKDDALAIVRGLYALQYVKGASWTVRASIVGGEQMDLSSFLIAYNNEHSDDPIRYSLPGVEI
ncbi:hypothetical protein [Anaerotruncus rubiinfantis]|uniref:hypothetical protein n=1 Tax=Anaerotruncus rubiinfantis TaxID=1720200 RepID=UPI0011C9DB2A|nr:hypothetical protein [Anaerotruncus rubiinfantis]